MSAAPTSRAEAFYTRSGRSPAAAAAFDERMRADRKKDAQLRAEHETFDTVLVEVREPDDTRWTMSLAVHGCRNDAGCWYMHAPGSQVRKAVVEKTGRRVTRAHMTNGIITDAREIESGWAVYVSDEQATPLDPVREALLRSREYARDCDSSTTAAMFHLRQGIDLLIDVVEGLVAEREGGR